MTITLTYEIETVLALLASRHGKTPEQVALDTLREHLAPELKLTADEADEGSAADLFAGRIGLIHGAKEALSQDGGNRFAAYVAEKHRAGQL